MRILKDPKERALLIAAIALLILLCIIEAQFKILPILKETWAERILVSPSLKNISAGLIVSFLAAYLFYLLIDFLPRIRREQKTKRVLDLLLASVLDAYKRCRIYGHETPISHVDMSVLNKDWLTEQKLILQSQKSEFLPLKFAMQTAFTRLEDFRHSLPLAVALSPERTMRWLIIIDKVRLLAENYDEQPEVPEDKTHLIETESEENPLRLCKSTLNFRLFELVEQTIEWQDVGNNEHIKQDH